MAKICNFLSRVVNSCFVIMYCCTLICYLYTIVLTKVTKNKDIHVFRINILFTIFTQTKAVSNKFVCCKVLTSAV